MYNMFAIVTVAAAASETEREMERDGERWREGGLTIPASWPSR
jgi:hypothetical protein